MLILTLINIISLLSSAFNEILNLMLYFDVTSILFQLVHEYLAYLLFYVLEETQLITLYNVFINARVCSLKRMLCLLLFLRSSTFPRVRFLKTCRNEKP